MPYFEKLPGQRIYLSPIDPADAELYAKWMNDIGVTRWLGTAGSVTSMPAEYAWLENNTRDPHNYQFAIVLRDEQRLIGGIGLMDLHQIFRTATLCLYIGEEADRSKGYGAEAIRLLLDFGFDWLGLHNIDLTVYSDNHRAIACYEKVGFREYGRRRESIFAGGQWVDSVMMEVLAADWPSHA